jgi:hypothetical protein
MFIMSSSYHAEPCFAVINFCIEYCRPDLFALTSGRIWRKYNRVSCILPRKSVWDSDMRSSVCSKPWCLVTAWERRFFVAGGHHLTSVNGHIAGNVITQISHPHFLCYVVPDVFLQALKRLPLRRCRTSRGSRSDSLWVSLRLWLNCT